MLDMQTLQIAAENGRVHCLTYCYNFLSNHGHVDLEYQDWSELVRRGHLECVPFLVEKGVPVITFLTFAKNVGNAKCIKYLHEQFRIDCWVPSTMAEAAGVGQLQLVKQLHELGCPWDESAIIAALESDEGACFRYLIDQRGIPTSDEYKNVEPKENCRKALDKYTMAQSVARLEKENSEIGRLFRALRKHTSDFMQITQK